MHPLLQQILSQQQPPQQRAPVPNRAQAVAAVHRFSSIRNALKPVIDDPRLGKENIRPKLLDSASKLLASKVLSLPEIMNAIKNLPDDPVAQKKFVDQIYTTAAQARQAVLEHHANAPDEQMDSWDEGQYGDNISGLMEHYPNGRR